LLISAKKPLRRPWNWDLSGGGGGAGDALGVLARFGLSPDEDPEEISFINFENLDGLGDAWGEADRCGESSPEFRLAFDSEGTVMPAKNLETLPPEKEDLLPWDFLKDATAGLEGVSGLW
jgi:hypothetical protein